MPSWYQVPVTPHSSTLPPSKSSQVAQPHKDNGECLETYNRHQAPKSPSYLTQPPGKWCSPHSFFLFPLGIPPIQPERKTGKCCPDLTAHPPCPACYLGRAQLSWPLTSQGSGALARGTQTRLALLKVGPAWLGHMLGFLVVSSEGCLCIPRD